MVTALCYIPLFEDFLLLKLSVKSNCFFLVKIDIDLSKTFPSVLTFYSANSMNFNTEFPTLLIFRLEVTLDYIPGKAMHKMVKVIQHLG